MSITSIEEFPEEQEAQEALFISGEDIRFNEVFSEIQGVRASPESARMIFDAGVNFVRDGEMIDSLIDTNGDSQLLIVNPQIIPPWMFRDAMLCYLTKALEDFTLSHSNGDTNTAQLLKGVMALEHVLGLSIPVDTVKDQLSDDLTIAIKKCEIILNDTI